MSRKIIFLNDDDDKDWTNNDDRPVGKQRRLSSIINLWHSSSAVFLFIGVPYEERRAQNGTSETKCCKRRGRQRAADPR